MEVTIDSGWVEYIEAPRATYFLGISIADSGNTRNLSHVR